MTPVEDLLQVLRPEPVGEGRFLGGPYDYLGGHLFGGHVFAQGLFAAMQTVRELRAHSAHAYFLTWGAGDRPVEYSVKEVFNGRSFANRLVRGQQDGRTLFTMNCSFHREEDGFEHQPPMPRVLPPERLLSPREKAEKYGETASAGSLEKLLREQAIEYRQTEPGNPFVNHLTRPQSEAWIKPNGPVPDDPQVHQCLLAYASDYNIGRTAMLPHDWRRPGHRMQTASIDHAIWFHRSGKFDDWLLFAKRSPTASGSLGLSHAHIYDRSGRLLATAGQQNLMRLKKLKKGEVPTKRPV